MKKTVINILSLSASGSHYLSLLLGSHSRAVHLGEVYDLALKRKDTCSICNDNDRCPLLHGIGPQNIDDIYPIIFSRTPASAMALIDTSKKVKWAERFIGRTDFQMKCIHLIRDPRAFVRRWSLDNTTRTQRFHVRWKVVRTIPRLALPLLFGPQQNIYMYRWLILNQEITQFIRRHQLGSYLVTYRDLAQGTAGELKKLMDWIGLVYEPTQLEYWNFEHHGTQKHQYGRIKKEKMSYFDLRWQTDLPQAIRARITTNPAINAYVKEMGLAFTDDGLTRL